MTSSTSRSADITRNVTNSLKRELRELHELVSRSKQIYEQGLTFERETGHMSNLTYHELKQVSKEIVIKMNSLSRAPTTRAISQVSDLLPNLYLSEFQNQAVVALSVFDRDISKTISELAAEDFVRSPSQSRTTGVMRQGLEKLYHSTLQLDDVLQQAFPERQKLETQRDLMYRQFQLLFPNWEPEYANRVVDSIERELSEFEGSGVVSKNSVISAIDPATGRKIIIKISTNPQKAIVESLASFRLGQDKSLEGIVAKGIRETPIFSGNYAITLQEFTDVTKPATLSQYLSSLAVLHAKAKTYLPSIKTEFANVDRISDALPINFAKTDAIRLLKDAYSRYIVEPKDFVIHADTKADNLRGGRILDLENMQEGHPAIDLALPLIQSGLPMREWGKYISTYLNTLYKLDPHAKLSLGENFVQTVKYYSIIPALKEMSGLMSRPIAAKERAYLTQLQTFVGQRLKGIE